MTTATENNVYEQVLGNIRQATESSLKMQQEMFQQWAALWPGMPTPQSVWIDKVRDFQKQWANTVSDLAHKHRNTFERQYQAALESLDEALRVGQAISPDEFRQRTENFVRKSLECMREASEAQMKEYQEALHQMSELVAKVGK